MIGKVGPWTMGGYMFGERDTRCMLRPLADLKKKNSHNANATTD